jgi:hypothetical protein
MIPFDETCFKNLLYQMNRDGLHHILRHYVSQG